jgi:hypothetical protein
MYVIQAQYLYATIDCRRGHTPANSLWIHESCSGMCVQDYQRLSAHGAPDGDVDTVTFHCDHNIDEMRNPFDLPA